MAAFFGIRWILTIGCLGLLFGSNQVHSSGPSNPVISAEGDVYRTLLGQNFTFNVSVDIGEGPYMFEIWFGDSDMHVKCCGDGGPVQMAHTYTESGVVTIEFHAHNNDTGVWTSVNVTVIRELTGTLVVTPVEDLVLITQNATVEVDLTLEAGTQPDPASDITCTLHIDSGDVSTYVGELSDSSGSAQITAPVGSFLSGNHTLNASCSNEFSSVQGSVVVEFVDGINTPSITPFPDGKFAQPTGNVTFYIGAHDGKAGARYGIDYDDGEVDVLCKERHVNFTITHNYKSSGIYSVSLYVKDAAGEESFEHNLLLQNGVIDMELSVSPTQVMYPNSSATYTLLWVEQDEFSFPPEEVTCEWFFGDGSVQSGYYLGNLTAGNYSNELTKLHGLGSTSNLTTMVNCSNLVSHQVMEVSLQVLGPIMNLSIFFVPDNYFVPLQEGNLTVTAIHGGAPVTYTVDFGDGYIRVFCLPRHSNFSIPYGYASEGRYVVQVLADDGGVSLLDETVALVQNPLLEVVLAAETLGVIPDGKVTLELNSTASPDPTNVTCTWVYPDGTSEDIPTTFVNGTTDFRVIYLGPDALGEGSIFVNCSNFVSCANDSVDLYMLESLLNLTVTAEKYHLAIDEEGTIFINMSSGSNVTYEVDYDNSTQTILPVDRDLFQILLVSYASDGTYNVSVRAYNTKEELIAYIETLIEVHLVVRDFRLVSDSPKPMPPGEVIFTLAPDVAHVPRTVTMQWNFGDGMDDIWGSTEFDQVAPVPYKTNCSYSLEGNIGNTTVTLNLSNPISYQLLEVNITLVQVVTELSLSIPKPWFETNESVPVDASLATGSHITYEVSHDDLSPNTFVVFDDSSLDVLNRQDTIDHAYAAPGNYYAVVKASNLFSNVSEVIRVDVQNPVKDLDLSSYTPVLTPPGDIVYTLTNSPSLLPSATNVTCNWVFDDGETDSTFSESLVLPQNVPHTYKPTKDTIKPRLNTILECENNVSSDSTSTIVEIDQNLVLLDKLVSDDPKAKVLEQITLTLTIDNYGHDPCFSFDFSGPELRKVVFGRSECQTLMPGFDEYYPQGETDTIAYDTTFTNWGIFTLVVTAENSISSDVESLDFIILPKACKRPDVGVGLEGLLADSPRHVFYSIPFTVHGKIAVDCEMYTFLSYGWKIERNVSGVYENYDYPLPKSLDLNIKALTLAPGDYKITLTGVLNVFLSWGNIDILIDGQKAMYVRVHTTPLKVAIDGGVEYSAPKFENLLLEAIASDPDKPGNTTGIVFKWACSVNPEKQTIPPIDWAVIPDFGFGVGDCFAPANDWTVEQATLLIPQSVLNHQPAQPSTNYSFTVSVEKEDRFAEYTQWVTFIPEDILNIALECYGENCKSLINFASDFVTIGTCLNCKTDEVLTYTWKVLKETGYGTNAFEVADVNLTTFTDQVGFQTKANFAPNTLTPGLYYKVKLYGETDGRERIGLTSEKYRINEAPYGGQCEVIKRPPLVLLDQYRIECRDWKDDTLDVSRRKKRAAPNEFAPLEYEMVTAGQLVFFSRDPTTSDMVLPGASSENGTMIVDVIIRDEFGTPAETEMGISVGELENMTDAAMDIVNEIMLVSDRGDIQKTLQLVQAALALESQGYFPPMIPVTPENLTMLYGKESSGPQNDTEGPNLSENFHDKTEIPLHGFLIDQIAKLNPRFPREVQEALKIVKYLSKDYDKFLEHTPQEVVKICDEIADAMTDEAAFTDSLLLTDLSLDLSFTAGNVVDFVATVGRDQYESCTDNCDSIKDDCKSLVQSAETLFRKAADLLVAGNLPGEPFLKQEEEKFTMIAGKRRAAEMSALVLGGEKGHLLFPLVEPFIADVEPPDCIQTLYLAFENNPYMWGPTAVDVTTPVQQVEFTDCDTDEEKSLLPVTPNDPYRIESRHSATEPEMTFTVVNDTVTQLVLHFFETRDPSEYVQLFFDPSVKNMSFHLYTAYDRTPDNKDYDHYAFLPDYPEGFDITNPEMLDNLDTPFSVLLPLNLTAQLGNFTVAAWVKVGGEPVGLSNYTFYIQYIKCRLFDWDAETWEPHGCQIENDTSATHVKFKSTIFADSLGAGLFVGPNTIDFNNVFKNFGSKLLANIHVLATIILMILVYVALTPVARSMDKADVAVCTPVPICGYNAAHPFHYQVDVYTGLTRGSGTTSKVYALIVGTKSDTGVALLDTQERKNFQTGDMNSFVVTSPVALGKLTLLRLFHDNSGEGNKASWFCEKVIVTEKHSKKKYLFLVSKWFSIAKGDGKIDRVVPVATREELLLFKTLFPRRSKKYFTNDHLWISVFYKDSSERFTRVQRLSCAVAAVFLTMIADAMWYQRDNSDERKDGFNFGPFAFTLQALWVSVVSVLTVLPVTFLMIFLFKHSKIKLSAEEEKAKELEEQFFANMEAREAGNTQKPNNPDENNKSFEDPNTNNNNNNDATENNVSDDKLLQHQTKKKKKKNDRFLPYWCRYIAWALVVLSILCSSFFSMLYSFEWGGEKSAGWLTAFLLSFTESEFLISPIKAIILAVIFSLLCKKLIDDDVEDGSDEYEGAVFRDDAESAPAPPTQKQIEQARRTYFLEMQLRESLRTLAYHALFLTALILVTYGNRDYDTFRQNETMRNLFVRNRYFELINSEATFFDWVENVVIPNVFMTEYNNGDVVAKTRDLRFTTDSLCYRLGPFHLRQYRIKPDACTSIVTRINLTCNVDYSSKMEDENDYALGWISLTGNDTIDVIDDAYRYRHDLDDETSYWGWLTSYYGGGYVANMERTINKAYDALNKLKEYRWMDRFTRAVVFKMNVYNANSNLFTMVSLMFEFPSYGAMVSREEIRTVKMYRYFGTWGVFALATEVILILLIVFLFIKMVYNIINKGCGRYLRIFWHKIELAKVVCTVLALGFYIQRTLSIKDSVEHLMNNKDEVVNFNSVVVVDEIFINLIGAALFLQILQLLWVLKFNKTLAELSATIGHSMDYLKSFFVSLMVIFVAFAMVAHHMYGTELWNYRDFLHVCYSQLISILGKFDANELVLVGGDFGRLVFMSYQLTLLYIFINLLIAIINETLADIHGGKIHVESKDEVIDLLIEKLGWTRKKNEGETSSETEA